MDDEGRENEGDLIIAADAITTEKMAWFIKVTRYVCTSSAKAPIPAYRITPSANQLSLIPCYSLWPRECYLLVISGYICIALPGEALERLELPLMVADNQEHFRTAYTITADYKIGMRPTSIRYTMLLDLLLITKPSSIILNLSYSSRNQILRRPPSLHNQQHLRCTSYHWD